MRTPLSISFAAVLFICACGGPDADLAIEGDAYDETSMMEEAVGAQSPSDRIVVWQQNIEGMKAGRARPSLMTAAMLNYFTYRPDIVLMQEAHQRVLCGDYLDAQDDVELGNWKGSTVDARGLSRSCRFGRPPRQGSVLYQLGAALWGGVKNVDHRRPFSDTLGTHTATGTAIAWDKRRFVFQDSFVFDDSSVPGCPTILKAYKRIAVLLRDTRRTVDGSDDQLVALASIHYGSACKSASDEWVAEQMAQRWATFIGRPLALRFIGGDFNSRVDETSDRYDQRRREEEKGSWYLRYTTNTSWIGKKFLDPFMVRHAGGTGNSHALCGQWTYPNVEACAAKTTCANTCPGWGIGGKLDRIDFLFVSNAHGTLSPARILSAETDDHSYGYSDHKGLRVTVRH